MLTGAMLAAAEKGMVVLIDGFIVTSALLVAHRLQPAILDYCVFAHCSEEAGHRGQLGYLGADPLLDLGLRLGEGTGAASPIRCSNRPAPFSTRWLALNRRASRTAHDPRSSRFCWPRCAFSPAFRYRPGSATRISSSSGRRGISRWSASSSVASARWSRWRRIGSLPASLSILAGMTATVLVTGAMHEGRLGRCGRRLRGRPVTGAACSKS